MAGSELSGNGAASSANSSLYVYTTLLLCCGHRHSGEGMAYVNGENNENDVAKNKHNDMTAAASSNGREGGEEN